MQVSKVFFLHPAVTSEMVLHFSHETTPHNYNCSFTLLHKDQKISVQQSTWLEINSGYVRNEGKWSASRYVYSTSGEK
jgi:hypothetical protein